MSRQRALWLTSRSMSGRNGSSRGTSCASSLATTAMVPSGLPSSCATAAASEPSDDRRCSRASAIWVSVSAASMLRASAATRET